MALVTAFSSNQTTEGKGKEGILAPCKVKEESLAQLLTVNLPPLMTLMMATMKLTWARQWILTNFSAADRSILGCQPGRRERTRCWGERLSNKTIHILCCLAAKSCLTLCNPVDSSLPGSSVYGISQVRIVEWVSISSSRDLPDPGIEPLLLMFLHWRRILYRCSTLPYLFLCSFDHHLTYSLLACVIYCWGLHTGM